MFRTQAILAACALLMGGVAAADPLTDRVEAPGVGVVKLKDAMQTCLADKAVGDVTAATGNYRETAFQGIAKALLAADVASRTSYWKYHDDLDWPTVSIEATYMGDVPWVPAGLIGSCQATGLYFVEKGIEIARTCREDKTRCKELFFEEEHEIILEALKVAKGDDGTVSDKLFVYLASHQDELETWQDPGPFLEKACSYPEVAMARGEFVDPNDLMAARWACIQQLVLITRSELAPLKMRCETPWSDVSKDSDHVATDPTTDLGLSHTVNVPVSTLNKRLYRMDNSVATCPADWAVNFRRKLLPIWRDSQAARACADNRLLLSDRAYLCPQLSTIFGKACDDGDTSSCASLSKMALEGIGIEEDERRRMDL